MFKSPSTVLRLLRDWPLSSPLTRKPQTHSFTTHSFTSSPATRTPMPRWLVQHVGSKCPHLPWCHSSPHRPPWAVSVGSGLLPTLNGSHRAPQLALRGCSTAQPARKLPIPHAFITQEANSGKAFSKFPEGHEVAEYIRMFVDDMELRQLISFETSVTRLEPVAGGDGWAMHHGKQGGAAVKVPPLAVPELSFCAS